MIDIDFTTDKNLRIMKQIVITVILCATALIALRIAVPKPEQKLSVIEAIHSRRSIREYKETPVEREKLLAVAKAGIAAPNAMNRQAWALRVVDSKEWIDACTAVYVETIKGTPMGDHLLVEREVNPCCLPQYGPGQDSLTQRPRKIRGLNIPCMALRRSDLYPVPPVTV